MRLFKCQECGQTVFFENRHCARCGHALGYVSQSIELLTLTFEGDTAIPVTGRERKFRYCANAERGACNWLVPAESPEVFCAACRHNRTIPNLAENNNLTRWQRMEAAKHRLFYTLIALNLPLKNLTDDPEHGLAFDFLAEPENSRKKILTGHDDGLITINLNEADDALRESLRAEMRESYRTLLGHFRHEIGHYFWNVLVRDAGRLDACRAVFGDDRQDYGQALIRYYDGEGPADWEQNFISSYASAHPWEDFAETWAHYLHIVDTLETASAFGLRVHPTATSNDVLHADIDFDPHHEASMQGLIDAWLPLTFAVNSLNRSMGHGDLYPFVLSPGVIQKMQFIHDLVHEGAMTKPDVQGAGERSQDAAPEQPPSQPPAPPGQPHPPEAPPVVEPPEAPVIEPPEEEPPRPGPPPIMPPEEPPVIRPPEEEPPVESPPDEIPPPPGPSEPPRPIWAT